MKNKKEYQEAVREIAKRAVHNPYVDVFSNMLLEVEQSAHLQSAHLQSAHLQSEENCKCILEHSGYTSHGSHNVRSALQCLQLDVCDEVTQLNRTTIALDEIGNMINAQAVAQEAILAELRAIADDDLAESQKKRFVYIESILIWRMKK